MEGITFVTCCSTDPAIDLANSRIDKFWISRDMNHLSFFPDKKPIMYHVRAIPQRMFLAFVEDAGSDVSRKVRAFMTGVVKADNVGGPGLGMVADWKLKAGTAAEVLSEEEMAKFPNEDVLEIGDVAYQRCFLRQESGACYAVALSSRVALDRALYPHVDDLLLMLDQSRDELRESLTQKLQTQSVEHTAVIAEDLLGPEEETPGSTPQSKG